MYSAGAVLYVAWIWLGPSSPLGLTQQHFAASCRKPSLATLALGSAAFTGFGTPLLSPFRKICMLYPKPLSAQHTTPGGKLSFRALVGAVPPSLSPSSGDTSVSTALLYYPLCAWLPGSLSRDLGCSLMRPTRAQKTRTHGCAEGHITEHGLCLKFWLLSRAMGSMPDH